MGLKFPSFEISIRTALFFMFQILRPDPCSLLHHLYTGAFFIIFRRPVFGTGIRIPV